ncbi:hypothetical protein DIPPA_26907 [Diplonema papillatum]|nr:hypothetical protein DIPPA_26907 [Diplonema papillatum]
MQHGVRSRKHDDVSLIFAGPWLAAPLRLLAAPWAGCVWCSHDATQHSTAGSVCRASTWRYTTFHGRVQAHDATQHSTAGCKHMTLHNIPRSEAGGLRPCLRRRTRDPPAEGRRPAGAVARHLHGALVVPPPGASAKREAPKQHGVRSRKRDDVSCGGRAGASSCRRAVKSAPPRIIPLRMRTTRFVDLESAPSP